MRRAGTVINNEVRRTFERFQGNRCPSTSQRIIIETKRRTSRGTGDKALLVGTMVGTGPLSN